MSTLPWVEKYKFKNLKDFAIIKRLRGRIEKMIKDQDIGNHILFYGKPGHGKTLLAEILMRSIKTDYMIVNGAKDNGIDYVRGPVTKFMGTASSSKFRKILFYDECDRLAYGQGAAADALKVELVKCQKTCSVIAVTNYIERLPEAFLSRFEQISLIPKDEKEEKELKKLFYLKALEILDKEKVDCRKSKIGKLDIVPDVLELIKGNGKDFKGLYPDFRSVLNNLQSAYNTDGEITEKMINSISGKDKLFDALRQNKTIPQLITLCNKVDASNFFDSFTDNILEYVKEESITDAFEAIFFYNTKGKTAISETANLASAIVELKNKKLKFKK